MDEKFKLLKEAFDPNVSFILKELPDGVAKERAIEKIQECVWWCEKSLQDAKLLTEKKNAAKTNQAE